MRSWAVVAMVALVGTANEAGAVTAVSCKGQTRQFGLEMAPSTHEETRLYVLSDERRTIMDYSPRIGAYRVLCERADGCRISYGTEAVVFSHGTDQSYQSLHLDRVAGTVLHFENLNGFSTSLFEGQCVKSAMPKPESKAQF